MIRLSPTHPAVSGSGLAAYHAERAAYYRRERDSAASRGEPAVAELMADSYRRHRAYWHAAVDAVAKEIGP